MVAHKVDGLLPPRDARIPLNQYARQEGIHVSTIHRWCQRGVVGRCGQRVRLRTVRVGGRTFITAEDLRGFFDAINESEGAPEVQAPARRTRARQRSIDDAKAQLAQARASAF